MSEVVVLSKCPKIPITILSYSSSVKKCFYRMKGFKLKFLHFIVRVTVLVQGLRPWFLTRLDLLFIFAECWDSALREPLSFVTFLVLVDSIPFISSLLQSFLLSVPSVHSVLSVYVCQNLVSFSLSVSWPCRLWFLCSSLAFACFHVCSPFRAQSFLSLSFVSMSVIPCPGVKLTSSSECQCACHFLFYSDSPWSHVRYV